MSLPPSRRLDFSEVPVLDIRPLFEGTPDPTLIDAIDKACADVGFFYVKNHGVPRATIQALQDTAARFFSLPLSEKMDIEIDQRIRGYYPPNRSLSAGHLIKGEDRGGMSHKEGFWIGYERAPCSRALLHGPNQWPAALPDLKAHMLAYFKATESLANVLLKGFALALGLEERAFDPYFEQPMSSLLLNHFPPQENPTAYNDIGLVPHADAGGFTILWQDGTGGLEIQNRLGEWVGAPPIDDTFVINIGNVMQMWSNGRFSSTPHRVINRSNVDRYSIPMFVNPSYHVQVEPLIGDGVEADSFVFGPYQRDVWRQTFPRVAIPE